MLLKMGHSPWGTQNPLNYILCNKLHDLAKKFIKCRMDQTFKPQSIIHLLRSQRIYRNPMLWAWQMDNCGHPKITWFFFCFFFLKVETGLYCHTVEMTSHAMVNGESSKYISAVEQVWANQWHYQGDHSLSFINRQQYTCVCNWSM